MRNPSPPPIENHRPTTFAARGWVAPFTSPALAATRVRMGARAQLELVVPNPSGGQGVYILPWSGLRTLCNPTLHDAVLHRRICALVRVEPGLLREAGLEVLVQGYAGAAAASAAQAARELDRSACRRARLQLIGNLLDRTEPGLPLAGVPADLRESVVLQRVAPVVGYDAVRLEQAVAALGEAFGPVGVAAEDRTARLPRLIERVDMTRLDLLRWLETEGDNDMGGLGRSLAGLLRHAVDAGSAVLGATRRLLADPVSLLRRWRRSAEDVTALAVRCEYLLDGWETVCLLWLTADSAAARTTALLEMAQVLPSLPAEVTAWDGVAIPPAMLDPACRVISHNDSWRSGSAGLLLIQRNEALRAMSL